ncbi:hypothetical protein LUZ60_010537 [Juncus effusus]|nr:hypothetical protein LUZ60_010537 [Juncus effusus]
MYSKRKYDGGEGRETTLKRQQQQYSNQYANQQQQYSNQQPLYGAATQQPLNMMYAAAAGGAFGYANQPPPFPVVRLRGLPFDCSEADVIDFFQGLDLLDILFVHKIGRFTGEAFCVLAYPLQVDFAIQRNRQNIGRRYIEVFRCKREEYYTAIAHEVSSKTLNPKPHLPNPPKPKPTNIPLLPNSNSFSKSDPLNHTGILRMRGLPFSAVKEDIVDFFKDFEVGESGVHLVLNSEGRASGEAFVEFRSVEDSREAMVRKDRMTLGSRYIELFPSHVKEMDEVISKERR